MLIAPQEADLELASSLSLVFKGNIRTILKDDYRFITDHGGVGVDLEKENVEKRVGLAQNAVLTVKVHSGTMTYDRRDHYHSISNAVIELP